MDIRTLRHGPPAKPIVRPDLPVSFTLWLEFEWWDPQPDDDPENNFFNMQIELSDQRVYALNVWTFKYFDQVRLEQKQAANYITAHYLVPPDLFVARLDRHLMEDIVAELIRSKHLRDEWLVPQTDEK